MWRPGALLAIANENYLPDLPNSPLLVVGPRCSLQASLFRAEGTDY